MEMGYTKYRNPYHNNLHAADVTQTVHYILYHLGFAVIDLFLSVASFFQSFPLCLCVCVCVVQQVLLSTEKSFPCLLVYLST